jgi:polyribonucleotide nucleotidyltransferase
VVILAIDDRGKVKLSMRAVDQETGERIEVERRPRREDEGEGRPERGERSDRGERGERDGGYRRRGGDDRPRRPRED